MGSTWRCQYVNSYGEQCKSAALHRLMFSEEHPFDHVDVCSEHKGEFSFFLWEHSLWNWPEVG